MIYIALLAIGVVCESASVFFYIMRPGIFVPSVLHCIGALAIGLDVYIYNSSERNYLNVKRPLFFYCAVVIAFFPVLGLIASAFLIFAETALKDRRSGVYEEYEEYVSEKHISQKLYETQKDIVRQIREDTGFESYVDILRWGDIRSKMQVISKIARAESRGDVELLRKFMEDASSEVRFFASGALMKLESAVTGDMATAEHNASNRGSSQDLAEYGDICRKYVDLGLAPDDLFKYYYSKACEAYKASLDINTEQPGVLLDYAGCLIDLGEYEKARSLLDSASKIWPANNELLFARAEALFYLRDAKNVFMEMACIDLNGLSRERKEVVQFWTSADNSK